MRVKVKEGKNGFIYGVYRNPGDEFILDNPSLFSSKWMERLESVKPKEEPIKNKPGPKPKKLESKE